LDTLPDDTEIKDSTKTVADVKLEVMRLITGQSEYSGGTQVKERGTNQALTTTKNDRTLQVSFSKTLNANPGTQYYVLAVANHAKAPGSLEAKDYGFKAISSLQYRDEKGPEYTGASPLLLQGWTDTVPVSTLNPDTPYDKTLAALYAYSGRITIQFSTELYRVANDSTDRQAVVVLTESDRNKVKTALESKKEADGYYKDDEGNIKIALDNDLYFYPATMVDVMDIVDCDSGKFTPVPATSSQYLAASKTFSFTVTKVSQYDTLTFPTTGYFSSLTSGSTYLSLTFTFLPSQDNISFKVTKN
jgi:hypothetical protein